MQVGSGTLRFAAQPTVDNRRLLYTGYGSSAEAGSCGGVFGTRHDPGAIRARSGRDPERPACGQGSARKLRVHSRDQQSLTRETLSAATLLSRQIVAGHLAL